jgi:ATP-dependent 26S proteasome regulatory subunit
MPSDPEDIIKTLRAALEATPDSLPLRRHLADLLLQHGRYKDAEQEYRLALDLDSADPSLKLSLAEAYAGQGKREVALFVLEEILRNKQAPARAFLMMARLYLQSGETSKAVESYRQATSRDPSLKDADLENAVASLEQGQMPASSADAPKVLVALQEQPGAFSPEMEKPSISFKDVGGMDKLKEDIRIKIIFPLSRPEVYQAYGKRVGGGILMYGPPGCGKTHLARATAGEVQARFLPIGIHDILDMYLGQSENNLHRVFETARYNKPSVLFFDEVDALGASRSDMRHSIGRHVINQFLSELDGITASNDGVLILAATNAPWHLDAALRRPGRFDRVIFVPPPDEAARGAILKIMLADKPADKLDFARLARDTDGFSGADLKGMVELAVEMKLGEALAKGTILPLTTRDLQEARKQIKPSVRDWFATARNYALYSNQSGMYDDVMDYIQKMEGQGFFQKRIF